MKKSLRNVTEKTSFTGKTSYSQERTVRKGYSEQDRSAKTGLTGQGSQDNTVRKVQLGQGRQIRTAKLDRQEGHQDRTQHSGYLFRNYLTK
jgi:hypothetical protein